MVTNYITFSNNRKVSRGGIRTELLYHIWAYVHLCVAFARCVTTANSGAKCKKPGQKILWINLTKVDKLLNLIDYILLK